jgi:hypothetical protein
MEIKITFSTIIGILMVVIVTIAAVAILSSLTKVSIFYKDDPCLSYNTESDCTTVGCKWCSMCRSGITSRQVNQWGADKCVDPITDCGYRCIKNVCAASCQSNSDCNNPLMHCEKTIRCECEL